SVNGIALAGAFVLLLATRAAAADKVVFVCAHGNVKSLIASEWFNRLAAERKSPLRAVARGLTPENPVPPPIVERLRQEGPDVADSEARALVPADAEGAVRLVFIGVEAPAWTERSAAILDRWDGIPPASERYDDSRDAIRARLEALLKELAAGKP